MSYKHISDDIIKSLIQIDDVDNDFQDDDDEESKLFVKAFNIAAHAAREWRQSHKNNDHADIHVYRNDNDELSVVITPK